MFISTSLLLSVLLSSLSPSKLMAYSIVLWEASVGRLSILRYIFLFTFRVHIILHMFLKFSKITVASSFSHDVSQSSKKVIFHILLEFVVGIHSCSFFIIHIHDNILNYHNTVKVNIKIRI